MLLRQSKFSKDLPTFEFTKISIVIEYKTIFSTSSTWWHSRPNTFLFELFPNFFLFHDRFTLFHRTDLMTRLTFLNRSASLGISGMTILIWFRMTLSFVMCLALIHLFIFANLFVNIFALFLLLHDTILRWSVLKKRHCLRFSKVKTISRNFCLFVFFKVMLTLFTTDLHSWTGL